MRTPSRKSSKQLSAAALLLTLIAGLGSSGCDRNRAPSLEVTAAKPAAMDPLAVVLAPHGGEGPLDARIRSQQEEAGQATDPLPAIEQLGWLFIAKARVSFDPGFYTLAEQCALALERRRSNGAEGLLLRGHALHNQHRFREAESLARRLVTQRGLAFDHGLLGDILADVGRVDEAVGAYQSMIDLKPDPQGYARVAHIRWIKGDRTGAIEAMHVAAAGGSPRDGDTAAWMNVQLARYLWQSGEMDQARNVLEIALAFRTNYPPALFLRGRMLLAEARPEEAVVSLEQAAKGNPLPEYQWVLAEALQASQRGADARAVERQIVTRGPATDPRTCSLYLVTQRLNNELALRLASREVSERADIFSHDAMAWALARAGRTEEAVAHLRLALVHGTQDARLFFHATVIMEQAGQTDQARTWLAQARELNSQLLPSERAELHAVEALLSRSSGARAVMEQASVSKAIPAVAAAAAATEE